MYEHYNLDSDPSIGIHQENENVYEDMGERPEYARERNLQMTQSARIKVENAFGLSQAREVFVKNNKGRRQFKLRHIDIFTD